jgi:Ca2+:H+ antiporter
VLTGWSAVGPRTIVTLAIAAVAGSLSGVCTLAGAPAVLTFVLSTAALAALAALVGDATEHLGSRLGSNATGILQSALGNLPELFIAIFALRAGLVTVVQAALVGSILGNSLLVLGLAFLVGGLRHGTQSFSSDQPRLIAVLTVLSMSAVALPTVASQIHSPASAHVRELSVAVAVVLLIVFVAGLVFSLRSGPLVTGAEDPERWPIPVAAVILAGAAIAAAFVSDWFVGALRPATSVLGISEAFTGLVIVALAGNAVENVVGIRLAAQNRPDLAISVILNSSLQVAVGLAPLLVLVSAFTGGVQLLLVLPALLVVAMALTAFLTSLIVYDGESTWVEGVGLISLYAIIAATFWWG